ncbi:MAG: hypothetical protein COA50_09505 [Flavobacteriaceae bacterium]|nr:MAG: hypothetical protein COA50_09505 [Flavobacteriaceae bacterium]
MHICILTTVLKIKTAKPFIKKSDFGNGVAFFVYTKPYLSVFYFFVFILFSSLIFRRETTIHMNCKNCKQQITSDIKFCKDCGAKVVQKRITVFSLFTDAFQNVFGWDNKFFFTVKTLIKAPNQIFLEYIDGTRKKYMNPIAFLLIGVGISIFLFNMFTDDFLNLSRDMSTAQLEFMAENIGGPYESAEYRAEQLVQSLQIQTYILKYFNLITFLSLPIYTFMAFLVYRKPYNYGEHLVINTYILGLGFLFTAIFFALSVLINPIFYYLTLFMQFLYYTYAYGKLYKLNIPESILKIFKFLGILIGLCIIAMILVVIITVLFIYIKDTL